MSAQPFYCENCGNRVSLHDTECPKCGKRFDAVKCPQCSFSGPPYAFEDGCPNCGYLHDSRHAPDRIGDSKFTDVSSMFIKEAETGSAGFPRWAYWVFGGVLFILIVVFVTVFFRL